MTATVVIAGAGHAAGQVVASLKHKQFSGRIILIGDEPCLPYQRPPLSKKYLAGELPVERLYFKPASFYEDEHIDVRLNTRVTHIDRVGHSVSCGAGDSIGYDVLVLALGSRVRTVPVPGSELAGVHYLRNIADVDRIRSDMRPGARIVIVGAGYIGLEAAAVCRELEFEVTVIEMADRVMSRVVSPQVSHFYQRQHETHGVKLLLSTALAAFEGNGRITAVRTADGRSIAADLVIIGAGIVPNTEIATAAGLAVNDGIVVDEYCRTGDPDIYAVGDCTRHPNRIYDRDLRLESVHNALEQARTAADNICGNPVHYEQVPWFWSDQYDIKLQIAGLSAGYDEVVLRGDPESGHFSCCYLNHGRLIAVDAINSPKDFTQSKSLIANHSAIDSQRLADISIQLRDLA